jgi:hypothetical protein
MVNKLIQFRCSAPEVSLIINGIAALVNRWHGCIGDIIKDEWYEKDKIRYTGMLYIDSYRQL